MHKESLFPGINSRYFAASPAIRFSPNHYFLPDNDRQGKILNVLIDDFEGKLNTTKWAKIGKCSQDTALRDIRDLIEKGIMIKSEQGGRSTNYELNMND